MAILLDCPSCRRQFRVKDRFRSTEIPCPGCKQLMRVDGPHVQGYDAFISYSSRDAEVASAVCAALEGKGVRCWIAPRDIPPGATWGASIIEGIEDSKLLLLIYSANSDRSDQVLREVERAVAKRIPLVPLRIDSTQPRKAFEYFLSSCHWLDASGARLETHLRALTSTVRSMLLKRNDPPGGAIAVSHGAASDPMPAVVGDVDAALRSDRPAGSRLMPVALAAVIALAAIGAFAGYRIWNDTSDADQAASAGRPETQVRTQTPAPITEQINAGVAETAATTAPVPQPPPAATADGPVDLLAAYDPQRHFIRGRWATNSAGLVTPGLLDPAAPDQFSAMQFLHDLPAEFDLEAEFTVDEIRGAEGVKFIVPTGEHQYQWSLGTRENSTARFEHGNFVRVFNQRAAFFTTHARHKVTICVRQDETSLHFDGRRLFRRGLDDLRGKRYPGFEARAIGVASWNAITLHRLMLVPFRP